VPHREEKRLRRKYCRKYVGLRLIVEHQSDSEIDSWQDLSKVATLQKPSDGKPIIQTVINLRIMLCNNEKFLSPRHQVNLDDSLH